MTLTEAREILARRPEWVRDAGCDHIEHWVRAHLDTLRHGIVHPGEDPIAVAREILHDLNAEAYGMGEDPLPISAEELAAYLVANTADQTSTKPPLYRNLLRALHQQGFEEVDDGTGWQDLQDYLNEMEDDGPAVTLVDGTQVYAYRSDGHLDSVVYANVRRVSSPMRIGNPEDPTDENGLPWHCEEGTNPEVEAGRIASELEARARERASGLICLQCNERPVYAPRAHQQANVPLAPEERGLCGPCREALWRSKRMSGDDDGPDSA